MLMKNNETSEHMTTSNANNSQFNNNEKYNKNKNDNNLSTSSKENSTIYVDVKGCLLYTSPSPRDLSTSRMPSSA